MKIELDRRIDGKVLATVIQDCGCETTWPCDFSPFKCTLKDCDLPHRKKEMSMWAPSGWITCDKHFNEINKLVRKYWNAKTGLAEIKKWNEKVKKLENDKKRVA